MPTITRTTHISFPNLENEALHDITSGIGEGSLSLDEILCAGNLKFGQCNSSKFEVQLYDIQDVSDQLIRVWQTEPAETPGSPDVIIPIFVGYVDSCEQDVFGYYRDIVAYDLMYYYGGLNVANWWTEFWMPRSQATLYELRESLCNFLNITRESASSGDHINDGIQIAKAVTFTNLSFRDALSMICELQCAFPHMSREGVLTFIDIDVSSTAVSIADKYERGNSNFEEYNTALISAIHVYGTDNSTIIGKSEVPYSGKANPYIVSGNIFAYGIIESDIQTAVNAMLSAVDQITYVPCDLKMIQSDLSISLGTKLTGVNNTFLTYVFKNSLSGSLFIEQSIGAEGTMYLDSSKQLANGDIQALKAMTDDLLESTIANELVSYQYTNATQPFTIQNEWVKIIDFSTYQAITSEETDLIFLASILLTANTNQTTQGDDSTISPVQLELKYEWNGGEIDYHPIQTYDDGNQILTLDYVVSRVDAKLRLNFCVYARCTTGGISIAAGDIIGYLMGQRLTKDTIKEIYVSKLPTIYTYYVGDAVNYSGVQVMGVYESGEEADVTPYCTFEPVEGTVTTELGYFTVNVTATIEE